MKKHFAFLLLLWGFLALPLAAQEQEDERIRSFDSHITVHDDGSMTVRETITVLAQGESIRHGIYREFPTRYRDKAGNSYSVTFDIVSVRRDGHAEPYHTSDQGNGVRVYFGDSSTVLAPGNYTYEFTYNTSRQLGFFSDHDELYWNVTGNDWKFPIDVATATILLPSAVRDSVQQQDGYTGYQSDKGKAFTTGRDSENNPIFSAKDLLPEQGLTIVVTWRKGLIAAPTAAQRAQWFVNDNLAAIVGLAGLALVWIYYMVVWVMVGRDPPHGSIVPLYEPPDNMSPATMRYLERMGWDMKAFTAAIMNLAAKGYLTIDRDKSHTYRLIRKAGYGVVESKLSSDEQLLARKLFENGATVRLDKSSCLLLDGARKALNNSLQGAMEKIYFVTNGRYLWPGVALTLITVVAMFWFGGGTQTATALFMTVWLTGWTLGVTVLLVNVVRAWKQVITGHELSSVGGAIFLSLFSLPFLAGECFGLFMLYRAAGLPAFVVMFAAIATNALFHHWLKAPTRSGRRLMDRIDGFKMFLKAVDGDCLQRMAPPPDKTPQMFERFLPCALALGVEQAWAEQFSQVLVAAGTPSHGGGGYSPSWYTGGGIAAFSAVEFTSSFSDSFSGAVSSASTPASSSSGSSGGGSSGGGGGGGGGGGW